MKKRYLYLRQYSVLLTLASLLWIMPSVNAQEVPPHTAPPTPQPSDITQSELANFDAFLDKHPEMAEQLRANPSLVNDRDYLNNHPALQAYLQEKPQVREELTENPRAFLRDERRYDRREDETTRRELAAFDGFLDKHPEIAEQLRRNPRLADNQEFLENHPALKQFLQDHSGVRGQLAQDPGVFMKQEDRFDRREGDRDRDGDDVNRRELATFDNFLDKHPEIAEQLRRNPALADNKEFLENHPALQQFLQEHPRVQDQLADNPQVFMKAEDRFDRSDNDRDRDRDRDSDANRREFANGFLNSHRDIADQLSKDPSLVKSQEYLENHPELRDYLNTHSAVQQEIAANPQAFMNSMKQFDNSNSGTTTTKKPMTEPKPKQ